MDKTMAGPLAHREVPLVTFEECNVDAFLLKISRLGAVRRHDACSEINSWNIGAKSHQRLE